MTFNHLETFSNILRELKTRLLEYENVGIISSDLMGTEFNVHNYSDNLYLFRNEENKLIYVFDEADDTIGEVLVKDLEIILGNLAERKSSQEKRVIEIERFLTE